MDSTQIIAYIKKEFPNIDIREKSDHYVLPTVCHNHNHSHASHKLYLYKNEEEANPLFHCYTDCSETFNVYQLIQKVYALNGKEIDYREAFRLFHGKDYQYKKEEQPIEVMYDKTFKNPLEVYLPEYNEHVLDLFSTKDTDPWAEEGLSLELLQEYKISYSKSMQAIYIPHYDWRGRLVGLRARTTDRTKEEHYKYMPAHLNNVFYRHPTSLNLYGIWRNQGEIKQAKKVWLYEGEKSCLMHTLLNDNKLALATCGKNISKWQQDMLIHYLGVEEVIIAYDKEYKTFEESFEWLQKIKGQFKYLNLFVRVGVMLDQANLFNPKEAPVDRGIEEFESMMIYYI